MDAHNLAVVFGPTLLRIPSEQDMIAYQSQVNGMIELLIKHCDEIFPGSGETLPAPLSEIEESESEEDPEPREAEALYDYSARSSKELSFKKGDIIQVFKRFTPEWWDGTINGTEGFVPDRYIRMLTDDEVDNTKDGEGSVSISGELSPSPKISSSGIDRPKDFKLPPRIPKRQGSLRGRESLPSPTSDHVSPAAASPITVSPIGVSSQGPSPGSSSFKKTSAPAISSEDIVKRQLTLLRKAPREEGDTSVDKTSDKEQGFVIPRLRSISPTRKSQSPGQEKAEDVDEKEEPKEKDGKGGGGGEASKEEHRKSVEGVGQPREEASIPANHTPPASPQTTPARKIPPAVRPKPKGNRNPQPPFRKNSDDLLASLQAAQVVRSDRASGGPDDTRKNRGSIGDDTAF
ncbi:SLIT-ROBO Rho GTPase-activating protein 2-like [Stylophora pistillata]|nr:SLIT-ROBO Rho GTPase-activating protein 2-like [Stylophora pistillata]